MDGGRTSVLAGTVHVHKLVFLCRRRDFDIHGYKDDSAHFGWWYSMDKKKNSLNSFQILSMQKLYSLPLVVL